MHLPRGKLGYLHGRSRGTELRDVQSLEVTADCNLMGSRHPKTCVCRDIPNVGRFYSGGSSG